MSEWNLNRLKVQTHEILENEIKAKDGMLNKRLIVVNSLVVWLVPGGLRFRRCPISFPFW